MSFNGREQSAALTVSSREPMSGIPIDSLGPWILEKLESFDGAREDHLVSVEFAHIYADELPGEEQLHSSAITSSLTSSLTELGVSTRTEVLIDDYNVDESLLLLPDLLKFLNDAGQIPDFVGSESSLEQAALELLLRAGRAGRSGRQFSRKRGRVPCSALIAAWYLERFRSSPSQTVLLHGDGNDWAASPPTLLVSVLPDKYLDVEVLARRLISAEATLLRTERVVTFSFSDAPGEEDCVRFLDSAAP